MTGPVLVVALALGLPTDPYIRSRADTGTPGDAAAHCLWWKDGAPVVYRQSAAGNPETRAETEFDAVRASFQSWQTVMNTCGNLRIDEGPRTARRDVGHDVEKTDNENVVVFRTGYCLDRVGPSDLCWQEQTCMNQYDCWAYSRGTIALTTTTYERANGRIYGADIELNAHSFVFTTVDAPPCVPPSYTQSCVATDVQNTMTHEIGHLLGLDHTGRVGSTMNPSAPGGEISKRLVDTGSRSFICEAYPQGRPSQDCVINPVKPELGRVPGCGGLLSAMLLAPLALVRRRSRQGS